MSNDGGAVTRLHEYLREDLRAMEALLDQVELAARAMRALVSNVRLAADDIQILEEREVPLAAADEEARS